MLSKVINHAITKYFLTYLEVQIFINLFSWPILIAWGLPVSLASPLGNFIFTPFLIMFLAVSLIVFLLELFYIPNTIFIYILEIITTLWLKLIDYNSNSWLLYLSKPSASILIITPILATVFIIRKHIANDQSSNKLHNNKDYIKTIFCLIAITISLVGYSSYFNHNFSNKLHNKIISLSRGSNKIKIFKIDHKLTILDMGALSIISSKNFIDFKLLPAISKNFGLQSIWALIVLKPNKYSYKSCYYLLKNFRINKIYLPEFSDKSRNKMSKDIIKYKQKLDNLAKQKNTEIIMLSDNIHKISYDENHFIELKKEPQSNTKYYSYNAKIKTINT